ncbi:MAG: methyltransferase [Thermoleophilia bacterium]|nr:methyltransferase [Thermoleophilia bacterium]
MAARRPRAGLTTVRVPFVGLRIPIPNPIPSRARARVRRTGVHVLMVAASVPVVRPVAERGFRALFDSLADDWERIRADPTYREGFREALAHLPRGFRPRRALDVACGTGIATEVLLARWPQLAANGFDISPRMVELASELVPGASFEVASVHHLPWADGEFDLVCALDGLLDLPELLRVLHRKGRLLVVYSRGGTTPISRPLAALATELNDLDAIAEVYTDGEAHVLVARHRR